VIKRELASYLVSQLAMSIRQTCRVLSLSRTVFSYQPDIYRDEPVVQALTKAADAIRDTVLRSFFRSFAGRVTSGIISEFIGFTAC